MIGKKRSKAIEEEEKTALFDVSLALTFLIAFTIFSIAVFLLQAAYDFMTAFYGSLMTENLMNVAFFMMTILLWLTYRRWKGATQVVSELENIISSISPDVLLVVDPDRTIHRCNQSIKKVFGYEVEETLNQKTSLLYEDRRVDKTAPLEIYEILEREGFHVGEALGRKKDGTPIHLEVITGKLTNRPSGAVVLLRDISVRKRLETELSQFQKMEAIGRLAGGVAHDFNNLITVISGFAKLIKARMSPSDPLRPDTERILEASERAANLTRQLLAFSRRQIVNPKVVNLNGIILNMSKLIRRLIGEDIELVTIPEKNLWNVKVDVTQIEQVLLNLTLNAREAMPKGGKIVIETKNVQMDDPSKSRHPLMQTSDYVVISVVDNGVGMTEEVKKHLFEPFFTTRGKGGGIGLGLATCYGIVKQNQGHISATSEPNQGTTIKVFLPRVEALEEKVREPKEPEILPQGSETIFLIEDEPMVRTFASRVLKEQGYQVIEATNGTEALNLIENNPHQKIQLLLTDMVMPQMGGEELAQKFRKLRPGLKVLFTSGYTDDAMIRHGVLEERVEFLQKPFSPLSLAVKVREVLDK